MKENERCLYECSLFHSFPFREKLKICEIKNKQKHIRVTNGGISFLFASEQYSICVYVYHVFFIHSSIGGYFGCFHVLDLANDGARSVEVQVCLQETDFIAF